MWRGRYEYDTECSPHEIVHSNGNRIESANVNRYRCIQVPITITDTAYGHRWQINEVKGKGAKIASFTLASSCCLGEDQQWRDAPIRLKDFWIYGSNDNNDPCAHALGRDMLVETRAWCRRVCKKIDNNNTNTAIPEARLDQESIKIMCLFMEKGYFGASHIIKKSHANI